jgi:hypothetical protein
MDHQNTRSCPGVQSENYFSTILPTCTDHGAAKNCSMSIASPLTSSVPVVRRNIVAHRHTAAAAPVATIAPANSRS